MQITLRTLGGWSAQILNTNAAYCDYCHVALLEAPHGGIYCDQVHDMTKIIPITE